MKIQPYIGLIAVSLFLSACGKDQVGYLVASEARYEPDTLKIRNMAIFTEREGWYNMDDFGRILMIPRIGNYMKMNYTINSNIIVKIPFPGLERLYKGSLEHGQSGLR